MSNTKQGALYSVCYVLNVEKDQISFLEKINESELDKLREFINASNDAAFKAGASRVTKRKHGETKTAAYMASAARTLKAKK